MRALAYDPAANPVNGISARRSHRYVSAQNGFVEADPERLFGMVVECVDEALAQAATSGAAFEGVSLCTFWHGLVGVRSGGDVTTPILTWADTRAASQAERLKRDLDAEAVRQLTGCALHPSYFPSKLAWWREVEPEVFARVDWWCTMGELCHQRFFGTRRCSYSMASGSGLLDRAALKWDPELLRVLRVPPARLSELCDLDAPSRGLVETFAARWPALKDVPWFPALGDGACSNIGCEAGRRPVLMIGTTGAFRIVRERPQTGPRVPVPPGLWGYLLDRTRLLLGGVLGDGGNLAEWMSGTLALGNDKDGIDEALLAASPAGHGLTVLPFLTGERSTGWNPLARGAVIGLRPHTSGLDILQAGLEAVAYRFAAVKERLREAAPVDAQVIATGGALIASGAWCQIIADVLELPVALSPVEEASSRGAALLALEALGKADTRSGTAVSPVSRTFFPRPGTAALHRKAREEQERLNRAIYGTSS